MKKENERPTIIKKDIENSYGTDAIPLMKDRGIIGDDETTTADVFERVINTIVEVDAEIGGKTDNHFYNDLIKLTIDKTLVYGTPLLTNLGKKNKTTAACTVLPLKVREGILDMQKFRQDSEYSLENALGTGYDLSELRDPVSSLIEMNNYLRELNNILIEQKKRPVASMATIRADHPMIEEIIEIKKHADFNDWRFNISIFVTEELFEKALVGDDFDLHNECGKITKKISAKKLLQKIAEAAHYCGEPGVLFFDRFNQDNPTPQWKYESTAPCAEVAMAPGEVCQFGYINLTNLFTTSKTGKKTFDFEKLDKSSKIMVRALDASMQVTIDNAGLNEDKIGAKLRIGVGIMGFAGLLINLRIPYDSKEAILLAKQISEVLDFSTKEMSVELAKKRGAFPIFNESRFTDKEWLQRKLAKLDGNYVSKIGEDKWDKLFNDILKYGIRNATTTAYPPTGTSSRIVGATPSFEPAFQLASWQKLENSAGFKPVVYEPVENFLLEEYQLEYDEIIQLIIESGYIFPDALLRQINNILATAKQISIKAHTDIYNSVTLFTDEAGAKTINLPNETSIEDIYEILINAYRSNLKGVTVFRDGCLDERKVFYNEK